MYSVYASQNGSIALNNCLTLSYDTILRVILSSRNIFSLTPILITNIQPQTRSPMKKGSPKKPFKGYKKILRGDCQTALPIPFYTVYEPHQSFNLDGDLIFDIKCKILGPCFVRIIWLDMDDRKIHQMGTPLYFLVWNNLMLCIKELTIQTILPNLVKNWDLNGFQAFHLCPIQQTSHSLYAIKDQLSIQYFKDFEELHNFIINSKKIFFIDIVLNHTAVESDWLDEEECVYNEQTVPQLTSALELDLALDKVIKFEDIEEVIMSLNLEQYFQIDMSTINWSEYQLQEHKGNSDSDDDENIFQESNQEKLIRTVEQYISNFGVQRYGVRFDLKSLLNENDSSKFSIGMLKNALKSINEKQLKRAKQYIHEAIINIQVHYKKYGCVQKYFHKLKHWYAAYNGYVVNIDPEEDFVLSQNFHFLRHTITKWNVIKLRYGDKKDTPLLLNRMKNYVCLMAKYFHGFRLDNCHGTPLSVSQYLLKHARMENPKLLVFAELFGCNYQQQIKYMSKLGLNALVDELCYCTNAIQLQQKLENDQFHPQLISPQKLIYDQTHDNQPSIATKQGPEFLMAIVSALSFSNQFKGTTKMVDEFYEEHISCVYEKRYYPQINCLDKQIIDKRPITFMYKHNVAINQINNQENGHGISCPKIVKMKGSFDNWEQEYILTNKQDNPKYYQCQIVLSSGIYEYKFIVDDVWMMDELQNHNEMNNIIEVQPIKVYKSLNFIRQLALEQQFQYCYMDAIHNSILIITRCHEDHLNNQIIVICLRPIFRKIQMASKIKQIFYQYSYVGQSENQNISQDEIPLKEHYIDISTCYAKFNEDILTINTPTAYVLMLECEPLQQIQFLNDFCKSVFTFYDLNLLYQPIVRHYDVPGCGSLQYSGLYGVMRFIDKIETYNDQFIQHIKEGDWLIDYLIEQHDILVPILQKIKALPIFLKPFYFIKCIKHIVKCIEAHYSQHRDVFQKQITVLTSYFTQLDSVKGRDTFMSFKGILLLTGKFIEGKQIIVKYGNLLYNGLIPNSLKPLRYNTRDTCFWWIKAIRDYITYTDDYSLISILEEQIQCIFQQHATGINFKEIHVNDDTEKEGLIINLQVDPQNGFIMGGNYKNCLTWMDKMGSGQMNLSYPAASRDGAPIECTALLKACLDFVNKLFQMGKYPFSGIKIMNRLISWRAWSDFICQHFEKSYYVPLDSSQFTEYQCIDKYVRRKGIYRDIFRCSKPRSEYQLRPNSCIAIALAPELFQRNHVIHHLALVEQHLMGPYSLGLSTLDSIASEYNGKYIQFSDKFSTQGGFSLHNGSEFIFLTGYYLKALLKIHKQDIKKEIFFAYLAPIKEHLRQYYALPDFTDSNGQLSEFAHKNSILSIALLKEAIFDLEEFNQKQSK